jgi:hypothetical protein
LKFSNLGWEEIDGEIFPPSRQQSMKIWGRGVVTIFIISFIKIFDEQRK